MGTEATQNWGIPVDLAFAVGHLAEQVVPEAAISFLPVNHELERLALIGFQIHRETLFSTQTECPMQVCRDELRCLATCGYYTHWAQGSYVQVHE